MGVTVVRITSGDANKELELSRLIAEGAIIEEDKVEGDTRIVTLKEAVNFTM